MSGARPLRVLFVDPVEEGSGEIITTLHMGRDLVRDGAEVRYLGSALAHRLLDPEFPGKVWSLGSDPEQNLARWHEAHESFRPHVVVFADLPFLWLSHGTVQLGEPEALRAAIEASPVPVLTLDHMGMAQRPMTLFFGPPHLAPTPNRIPAMPASVECLLPCPMHEPGPVASRKGLPFRYWDVPFVRPPGERERVRASFLRRPDELLVVYPVPGWAPRVADAIEHPYYRLLPELFEHYLGELPREVTVVAVNGQTLPARDDGRVRIVRTATLPVEQFEALLFAADLLLTDNGISIAMGKALCGFQISANLRNRWKLTELAERLDGRMRALMWAFEHAKLGSIYPYEVFPSGTREDLEVLGLYRDNGITEGFATLELFGGAETRAELRALLLDESRREALRERQRAYVERLAALPTAAEVLRRVVESGGVA